MLPAQSSRTGQTSHSPMSIVTSRLSTATWNAPFPRRVDEEEQDQPVQQRADHLRALCRRGRTGRRTRRSRSGGDRRIIRTRSATVTPPSPSRGSPRRRGTGRARPVPNPIAIPPSTSPTAHDASTVIERPLRTDPVAQPAPDEAHRDRDDRQPEQDRVGVADRTRPSASIVTTLITTMTVLTASL